MKIVRSRMMAISSLPLLILFTLLNVAPASAAIYSNLNFSNSAQVGKWGAQLATATGNPSASTYSITWTGSVNKQYELISLVNTGSLDLIAGQVTFTTAKANGDTTGIPLLTFDLCSGTWDSLTFTCSGLITTAGSATSGSVTLNRLIQVGNRLVIRVTGTRNGSGNYISALNTSVGRNQIRSGIVINS